MEWRRTGFVFRFEYGSGSQQSIDYIGVAAGRGGLMERGCPVFTYCIRVRAFGKTARYGVDGGGGKELRGVPLSTIGLRRDRRTGGQESHRDKYGCDSRHECTPEIPKSALDL